MRQVNKPRKSESDKTDKVKPTAEEVEEFGEDKKEKETTTVVSGAKTGEKVLLSEKVLLRFALQERAMPSPRLPCNPTTRSRSPHMRRPSTRSQTSSSSLESVRLRR